MLVKEKIKHFIDNEDKSKPLSDDRITQLINEAGLDCKKNCSQIPKQ
jgi:DNA-directed RNA polymerase specialized sigma54-like protein